MLDIKATKQMEGLGFVGNGLVGGEWWQGRE